MGLYFPSYRHRNKRPFSHDYGTCAFMDAYDPKTVFSSIVHSGRYAFANQPVMAEWNLTRLAEACPHLIDPDTDRAIQMAKVKRR